MNNSDGKTGDVPISHQLLDKRVERRMKRRVAVVMAKAYLIGRDGAEGSHRNYEERKSQKVPHVEQ